MSLLWLPVRYFYRFLESVNWWVSVSFVFSGCFSFFLFVCFVMFQYVSLFSFIFFYYGSLEACLFSYERQKGGGSRCEGQ